MQVSTTHDIIGYRLTRQIGFVSGMALRSRNEDAFFRIGAQRLSESESDAKLYFDFAERARQGALDRLIAQAEAVGANAVIGMRYESSAIAEDITEVLAYGTAVVVEPTEREGALVEAPPPPAKIDAAAVAEAFKLFGARAHRERTRGEKVEAEFALAGA